MRLKTAAAALVLLVGTAPLAHARNAPAALEQAAPIAFATHHSGTFNGQKIKYLATVGETIVNNDEGEPVVRFVTTSYVREGVKDQASRPVIFLFNGGPSTASAWLRMGAFGPRRISAPQDPKAEIPKPYKVVDNTYTVLDVADLVFIDPPETGFSRVLPAGKRADFYEVDGDAAAVSRFVETWLKANGREASPKYLLAESYGTLRATVMAGDLAKTMPLDGVMLFGQAVNMIETSQRPGNPISFATNITALAAIAAYHGRADTQGKPIAEFVDEAYAFGMGEYLQALVKGNELPAAERQRIAQRLQAFTGISADYYLAHDLIISKVDFVKELLKDQGQVLGMYDARYAGPAAAPGQRPTDPFGKVSDMVEPALKEHLAKDLGVTLPASDYRMAAPDTRNWDWSPTSGIGGPFNDFDYQANFAAALKAKPDFRLMIGTGLYDTTTTVGPARYLKAKGVLPPDRVQLRQYEGGHMSYTNEDALKAMTSDVRAFVTGR
ncbi:MULTISPECIES: S10 family peptidase [Phenylobacterium]|uniref:Carboxypeptidase C (Cathepsin A) n=1 Tax=Phenylobacterium koreense TaxID=266125 RepID=A0ABV2EDX6_9CAUL